MKTQLGNQQGATEAAAIFAAMRLVVDYVPIIGSFYAAMIDAVPGVIETFRKSYIDGHLKQAAMARDNIALFNKMQNAPQARNCKQCGKRVMTPCKG